MALIIISRNSNILYRNKMNRNYCDLLSTKYITINIIITNIIYIDYILINFIFVIIYI